MTLCWGKECCCTATPTNQLSANMHFSNILGWSFEVIHVCKNPRGGGEGFTFWPMDYYECSPSFLFPFPRSLMPLLTIQSNLWMKKCWGMFYLKVFPTSTSSLWLFSEPLGYYLLHLKIRRYNDHCNCSNNCPRQTKKDKLISYMKQCKHIW